VAPRTIVVAHGLSHDEARRIAAAATQSLPDGQPAPAPAKYTFALFFYSIAVVVVVGRLLWW
jgi:hypothetical protein